MTTEDQAAARRSELSSGLYPRLRRHVQDMAVAGGAAVIERPIWSGSLTPTTYAERLAGLREAVPLADAVARVTGDYVRYARVEGASWAAIGAALGITGPDGAGRSVAELAYERPWASGICGATSACTGGAEPAARTLPTAGRTTRTRSTTSTATLMTARGWLPRWQPGRPSRTAGKQARDG